MKKLKNLFLVLMAILLVVPFGVFAAEDDDTTVEDREPVKVYLFHSTSCPHCQAAIAWFESIEEEYGKYFDLVEYEVSSNQENSLLFEQVASFFGDSSEAVPYMVVGNYTYPNGFGSDSVIDSATGLTQGEELIGRIMEIYESDDRYDVMFEMNNQPDHSVAVGIVSVIVIGGIVALIVISRKQNA